MNNKQIEKNMTKKNEYDQLLQDLYDLREFGEYAINDETMNYCFKKLSDTVIKLIQRQICFEKEIDLLTTTNKLY